MCAEVEFEDNLWDDATIIDPELPKEVGNKTHFHHLEVCLSIITWLHIKCQLTFIEGWCVCVENRKNKEEVT